MQKYLAGFSTVKQAFANSTTNPETFEHPQGVSQERAFGAIE